MSAYAGVGTLKFENIVSLAVLDLVKCIYEVMVITLTLQPGCSALRCGGQKSIISNTHPWISSSRVHRGRPVNRGTFSLVQILYRTGSGEAVCIGKHGLVTKSLHGSCFSRISNNDQMKTFDNDSGIGRVSFESSKESSCMLLA